MTSGLKQGQCRTVHLLSRPFSNKINSSIKVTFGHFSRISHPILYVLNEIVSIQTENALFLNENGSTNVKLWHDHLFEACSRRMFVF